MMDKPKSGAISAGKVTLAQPWKKFDVLMGPKEALPVPGVTNGCRLHKERLEEMAGAPSEAPSPQV
jgi:hypothetical protein